MPQHPALALTLESIARLELPGGIRSPRLTEPGWERWHRVRRKLGWADLIALVHQDLAEAFPYPFDLDRWHRHPLEHLSEDQAEQLVISVSTPPQDEAPGFLRRAARTLGLPAGGALSDLPRIQAAQRALELPGAGGRMAFALAQAHSDLSFHDHFDFVADTDAERVMVGLAAVEARAGSPTILTGAALRDRVAKGHRWDRVYALNGHPAATSLARDLDLEVRWA